jgi:tetratricopeptide (TPR) repeat protein
LRQSIAAVHAAPQNQDSRRRLRALVSMPALLEASVPILAEEARNALCDAPATAAIFLELLVHLLEVLDRPLEAVTTLEQLVALAPDNVDYLHAFGLRCVDAGAWAKAADTFERVGALAKRDQACVALRAAAKLYRDHSQLDRAADAYRAIIHHRPADKDAWCNLEELFEQLGRWNELADVRGELAKRAANPLDKAALLRAQARALEQAGDTAAAADAMAGATRCTPDDISGLVDFADVLARSGKPREAADVLAKAVVQAVARHMPVEELAGLRARHAAMLEDGCGDRAGAVAAIETLLAEHPTYVPALERLVWHASHDPDPCVHAAALARYAAAVEDPATKAQAYVDAARRYRDARAYDASTQTFRAALEIVVDDRALRAEYEEVRAAIDVGRAADELSAGDVIAAEHRLREILGVRPHDPDANLALADLLIGTNKLETARDHLREVLASAPEQTPKAKLAPLAHKCALVVATLGDSEEAHRLLHEAHLLDRHALLITLDLGQSCFARKLWRQAVLYLAPLADHPDAPRHAARVAEGLVQAAQAEVRALRPANALEHYEVAVRLDPTCAPAWHALAADAMERGDTHRAIECFEREAAATTTPSDRIRLFDALGDLALDVLGDRQRAETYWSTIADGNLAVLDKLYALQRDGNADVERAETCVRIAELDRSRHRTMTEEAAEAFAGAGDFVRARTAAERLIATYPLDVDAVACASRVVLAACDADSAAAWLRRALDTWETRRSGDPRHAELWLRLGDAERSRQRPADARAAYERAIVTAPDSPHALLARRALMELTPKSARTLESLEVLVEAEQSPMEVIELARGLVAADRVDDARAMFDLARALDVPLTPKDEQFLATSVPRPMGYDEAYGRTLDETLRNDAVEDERDAPLAAVLDLLGEAVALLTPDPATALFRAALPGAKRLSATSHAVAAAMYPQVSKALAGPMTLFYTTHELESEVCVLLSSPPVIVIGSKIEALRANDAGPTTDPFLRFTFGRVVELARPRRLFAADPDAFVLLANGLWRAFGPSDGEGNDPAIEEEAKRLRSVLPIPLRRRISEQLATISRDEFDPTAYVEACNRSADRSGLLACGDATAALELAGGRNAAPHLVRFAASRKYRTARRALRARGRATTV